MLYVALLILQIQVFVKYKHLTFENRDGRVWVSLTDMAKASGKKVNDWSRLSSTTEFLTEFEGITGIPVIESKVGNVAESERGTWAIEEVALEFAGLGVPYVLNCGVCAIMSL